MYSCDWPFKQKTAFDYSVTYHSDPYHVIYDSIVLSLLLLANYSSTGNCIGLLDSAK